MPILQHINYPLFLLLSLTNNPLLLLPQNPPHRLTLCQFIDQLIQNRFEPFAQSSLARKPKPFLQTRVEAGEGVIFFREPLEDASTGTNLQRTFLRYRWRRRRYCRRRSHVFLCYCNTGEAGAGRRKRGRRRSRRQRVSPHVQVILPTKLKHEAGYPASATATAIFATSARFTCASERQYFFHRHLRRCQVLFL